MTINLELNHKRIINVIRKNDPISRIDISEMTNMTRPTITRITDDLLKKNIIKELGTVPSSRGRRPVLLSFNHKCYYSIGVHLGKSIVKIALTDLNGNIIKIKENDFSTDEDILVVTEYIKSSIHDVIVDSRVDDLQILGIGIGLPGPIENTGEAVHFPFMVYNNSKLNLRELLADDYELPIAISNDSNAAAIAEKWFGRGIGSENFISIRSDIGVGSGIITNGELYKGFYGHTGMIGHTTIDLYGEKCNCGNYGCLETLVTIPKIEEKARKKLKVSNSKERSLFNAELEQITFDDIISALNNGSLVAKQLITEAGNYLGIGIANAINIMGPELVIVGGKLGASSQTIIDAIKATVFERALANKGKTTPIVASDLENSVVLGAAALMIDGTFSFYSGSDI